MSDTAFRRGLRPFRDLPAFIEHLQLVGEVARIVEPVSTFLDATEIHRRVIASHGPVLWFERPVAADGRASAIPLVVNLFGTVDRVAAGLGTTPGDLRALGEMLAALRHPIPPRGLRDALRRWPELRAALDARPDVVRRAASQAHVRLGADIDLGMLPIQTCWPGEPAPLIAWPIVITRPPDNPDIQACNLGIYRMQVLGRDRAILRWLARRGVAAAMMSAGSAPMATATGMRSPRAAHR